MWESIDKKGYSELKGKNLGQICNDEFSIEIEKYATNLNYKTYLEIGTWNGLGSTRAFSNGFKNRTDEYIFYSLECNKDKNADAAELYKDNDKIHILNEVIWNERPEDFYQIFPKLLKNDLHRKWNQVDVINMRNCKIFLDRPNLPEIFDVILLDGGEFTTYYDFKLLKNRCKILMLDDTNTDKCKLIVNEISSDSTWRIIKQENLRNGFLIAEKIF